MRFLSSLLPTLILLPVLVLAQPEANSTAPELQSETEPLPQPEANSTAPELQSETEPLPQPEAYRHPNRPYRTRKNNAGRSSLLPRPTSSVAQSFFDSALRMRSDKRDRKSDYLGDLSASASEYGNYASESGYGHSCSSGYLNSSAVALLAFLFLLNLVQDIIQQVTAANRRKRDTTEYDIPAVLQFVQDGQLEMLTQEIPNVVIPLIIRLSDASPTDCLAHPICMANAQLSSRHGGVGRVFATLLSNVVSHAFSHRDKRSFDLYQEAAYLGRKEGLCYAFEHCLTRRPGDPGQNRTRHEGEDNTV